MTADRLWSLAAAVALVAEDGRRRRIADAIGDRLDRLAADLDVPPARRARQ